MFNSISTINRPRFVTFTGADDETNVDEMFQLSCQYPIEWGLLFSRKRQGSGRYPSLDFIRHVATYNPPGLAGFALSAHLCGEDAREILAHGESQHDALLRGRFKRAQINTVDPHVDVARVAAWGRAVGVMPILQCRGSFPSYEGVQSLFDTSGGRGLLPDAWPPAHRLGEFVGYAGGLRPENIHAAAEHIGRVATVFWLDMESGVRTEDDRFSLQKCRAVCEVLFGAPCEHTTLANAA